MAPAAQATTRVAPTGIEGLDLILGGGLPRDRIYLLQGDPGVGKTTLSLQFLLEGVARGESGLYITLSETEAEIRDIATSHGWTLDGLALMELSALEREALEGENTMFDPSEVDLRETTQALLHRIEEVAPARIVFDSLSELRLLAQSPLRFRRQILSLKQYFAGRRMTVLMLDDNSVSAGDQQLRSLAHGVVSLEQMAPEFGEDRRRLRVVKLRGVKFRGGYHDFMIRRGGLDVFPRLIAAEHHADYPREHMLSGVAELDQLLGGGLDRGTSTLLTGPPGTGKSALATQYAAACASRGHHAAIFAFDESRTTLVTRADALGMDLSTHLESGRVALRQIDPAELSPGELAHIVRQAVERDGARLIVIDSLNGYLNAMPSEPYLTIQMHELLTYLGQKGVATILIIAPNGLMGSMQSPVDMSYLADSIVLLRYFEAGGRIRKAISVVKKRGGRHEDTIREFVMADRLRVGPVLAEFEGVLTGTPRYRGSAKELMRS